MANDLFAIGKVKAPNGLKGKMWINPLGDTLNRYDQYIIGSSGRPRKLSSFEERKTGFVIKLEGIDDINQVEQLKGQYIYVLRQWLPETDDDEYYWEDLIGMKVIDIQGRELGNIISIISTGSNDVLVVDEKKQHMIPLTNNVIMDVSIETNTMTVDITSLEDILDIK